MPDRKTFFRWLQAHEELRHHYALCAHARADAIFEETIEIADDSANDYTINADGVEVLNQEHVQRARLRVDTRKWFVSKLMPRKYGDRLEIDHQATVRHEFNFDALDSEQLSALSDILGAAAEEKKPLLINGKTNGKGH